MITNPLAATGEKRPDSPASRSRPVMILLLALAGAGLVGWLLYPRLSRTGGDDGRVIGALVSTEERILELTPQLRSLAAGLLNLQLPEGSGRAHFAAQVEVKDLADGELEASLGKVAQAVAGQELSMWTPLLDGIDWFEHASFYFIDGRFPGEGFDVFEGEVGFAGLAKMKSGGWRGLSGKQLITWRRDGEGWKIIGWEMKKMGGMASPQRLFEESLAQALPRAADYQKARRSVHQEAAIKFYQSHKKEMPHPYFAPISANQKPGISVVDIEGDGDDDIYVTVRIGENLLLENQGDGTFIEAALAHGIRFTGHGTSVLFADFDNDGDPDLLLGRSLRPSLYFENQAGYFHALEQEGGLPMLVVSMSAADYNGDGLLDFYLCTYRPATIKESSSPSGGVATQLSNWPDQFFEAEVAAEFYRRYSEANRDRDPNYPNLLDQIGPHNYLYVNRGGGRFEVAPENGELGVWRNSLQATWSDFDEDGDPDVYIANDWARDNFFRNDGADGFVDITEEAGTTAFGFAMGASWGDYDNDGKQDLYVSNMYSKAGQRITRRVAGELNRTYVESAAGNYLYRQGDGGRFELVSGFEKPKLQVANGGWGWGGQFADFDNDGFLDIYALSGYFTAPGELASDIDL